MMFWRRLGDDALDFAKWLGVMTIYFTLWFLLFAVLVTLAHGMAPA